MDMAIHLHNVTKKYNKFTLDHVNLDVPKGSIVGLVGENGAGKTTIIKCILQMISTDEGMIYMDGKALSDLPQDWKKDVGVILSGVDFAASVNAKDMEKVLQASYDNWDSDLYNAYLSQFHIDKHKKIKEYSKGLKMKLCLAIALSHNAKLLIFDEATSGLDPVVRDDILDILLTFIQDENHSVLLSSHITSDLEKVADYIAFLHDGRLQFCMNKDEMLYRYGVIRCNPSQYEQLSKDHVQSVRRNQFGYEVLVTDKDVLSREHSNLIVDKTSIEEIILFMIKGEKP